MVSKCFAQSPNECTDDKNAHLYCFIELLFKHIRRHDGTMFGKCLVNRELGSRDFEIKRHPSTALRADIGTQRKKK